MNKNLKPDDKQHDYDNLTTDKNSWIEQELAGSNFKDVRLKKRYRSLIDSLWRGIGETIPFACQDWANTKAAYRFIANERVDESDILRGHFQSTRERFTAIEETVLIMHDTTEFSYQRSKPEEVGLTRIIPSGKDIIGKPKYYTKCGILMHSSLAVTTTGLPLGLTAIKFWSRKKFKGADALKKRINPTRISIEKKESYRWLANIENTTHLLSQPGRCVHIGDRESDIYELYCKAQELGTHFVIRTCVNRLAGDGNETIATIMAKSKLKGRHRIQITDKHGKANEVILAIKFQRIKVLPPIGKQKHYPAVELTVIHAIEQSQPKERERISWKLITDLPIDTLQNAIEKLEWYAMRWKIETFHKILKSGCKAENAKLRTADRLTKLISVYCILSWRIFWMTMIKRCCPELPPENAVTDREMKILDYLVSDDVHRTKPKTVKDYITKIAKIGGYLARNSDPPPGNIVMWRGLSRLTDIQLGFNLAMEVVGN